MLFFVFFLRLFAGVIAVCVAIISYMFMYPGLHQQPTTAQTFWLSDKNFTSFGCVFAYLCLFAAGICADGCGRPAQGSSCKLLNATAESVGHFGSKLGDLGSELRVWGNILGSCWGYFGAMFEHLGAVL